MAIEPFPEFVAIAVRILMNWRRGKHPSRHEHHRVIRQIEAQIVSSWVGTVRMPSFLFSKDAGLLSLVILPKSVILNFPFIPNHAFGEVLNFE